MPVKERTLIPRTSPFKSKGAGALKPNPALSKNTPITLRGTGRPISTQDPASDKLTSLPPRALLPQNEIAVSSSNELGSSSINPDQRRNSGSRIPTPFRGTAGPTPSSSVGLGLSFPAQNPSPNSPAQEVSPPRQRSPVRQLAPPRRFSRFHVPLIHSPAPKSFPPSSNNSDTITAELVAPPSPVPDIMAEQPPWKGMSISRTPTTESSVSSTSAYSSRSDAEIAGGLGSGRNEMNANRDEKGKAAGDQSPGFSMIEAIANKDERPFSPARSPATHSRPVSRPVSPTTDAPLLAVDTEPQLVVTNSTPRDESVPPMMTLSQRIAAKSRSPSPRPMSDPLPCITNPRAPQAVLSELELLVGRERMEECLDVEKVLEVHDAWRVTGPGSPITNSGSVFGAPLSATTHYASCSSILGGRSHTLPLVVFATVEELYLAGLRSPCLLRPPPHSASDTFPALVAAYNSTPAYGDDIDLASTPLDDVGALLLTYLDCLPGPVLVPSLRRAFVELCVRPGFEGSEQPKAKPEEQQLRTAQLILRLLPAPHFSLLVYLLAFLSQIPLHERWNGWTTRGVARAFARVILGPGADDEVVDEKGKEVETEPVDWVAEEEKAVSALEWLLRNWDDLSDGLFKAESGEHTRLSLPIAYERTLSRRPSRVFGNGRHNLEKDVHRVGNLDPTATPGSPRMLLARISELEQANAEWRRLQGQHDAELRATHEQHEAELRAMFDEGERQMEEAVLAERKRWVGEVQMLMEGWERMGRGWEVVEREREAVGRIIGGVVMRLAKGAPGRG